jgi:cell division protein FtsB
MKRTSARGRDSGSDMEDGSGQTYRKKRDKNNVAVKKSREKSRQKESETKERVSKLKKENEQLESHVKSLSKELTLLKEMVVSYAANGTNVTTETAAQPATRNRQASRDTVTKDHDYSSFT